jgi:hypothetical protein
MFARSVTMHLKPNSVAEFNRTVEREVLPLLQKQKGFREELTLISSNWIRSGWDQPLGSTAGCGRLQPVGLF